MKTTRSLSFGNARAVVPLIALSALAVLGWALLYHWYALVDLYATPGFALDRVPGHFASTQLRLTTLIFVLLGIIYAASYWLLQRVTVFSAWVKATLIALFAATGAINVALYPVGAIDLFSYLGQLKLVFFYGRNPYLFTFLPTYAADPLAKLAAFLELPIVYGPAWVILGGAPLALAGFTNVLRMLVVYKLWSLVLLLLSGWCVYRTQPNEKQGWLAAFLLLGNPLVLFEAVGNAHNDVMMTAFLLAAVLAVRRRSPFALALVAVAALVKAFTVVLLPVFMYAMYRQQLSRRTLLLAVGLALLVGGAAIAPFWAGGAVLGGMLHAVALQQQAFSTVSLVSLAHDYVQQRGLTQWLNVVRFGCLGVFLCAALLVTLRVKTLEHALIYLLLLFYLLVSSFYPWYLVPVVGLLAIAGGRNGVIYLFTATPLALFSYAVNIWARFDAGWSLYQMRLGVAACVTLPVVVLLVFGLKGQGTKGQGQQAFKRM